MATIVSKIFCDTTLYRVDRIMYNRKNVILYIKVNWKKSDCIKLLKTKGLY